METPPSLPGDVPGRTRTFQNQSVTREIKSERQSSLQENASSHLGSSRDKRSVSAFLVGNIWARAGRCRRDAAGGRTPAYGPDYPQPSGIRIYSIFRPSASSGLQIMVTLLEETFRVKNWRLNFSTAVKIREEENLGTLETENRKTDERPLSPHWPLDGRKP